MKQISHTLLTALHKGIVSNVGSILMDVQDMPVKLTFTQMYEAVCELNGLGYEVQRIDSGGEPTWKLMLDKH